MIHLFWLILKLVVVVAILALASQYNSPIFVNVGVYQISFTSFNLCIVLCLLLYGYTICVRVWLWLANLPENYRRQRQDKRRAKGYQALTRGMVAVAAGEKIAARKCAKQAENILQEPPLTMLLSAQSAQLDGDELSAKRYFQKMLDAPEMAFLGFRGLIMQALKAGELSEAETLIQQAETLFPKQPWLYAQNLELQERLGHTRQAVAMIRQARAMGSLSPPEADAKFIALNLHLAQQALAENDFDAACSSAEAAWQAIQISKQPFDHAQSAGALQILWRIAVGQHRFSAADDYLRQLMSYEEGSIAQVFAWLEERLNTEGVEGMARWKKQKKFVASLDQTTGVQKNTAARYMALAALKVGLIGEAEMYLQQDSGQESRPHAEVQMAIAMSKKDSAAIRFWQEKMLHAVTTEEIS